MKLSYFGAGLLIFVCMTLGNLIADQFTIRDCAAKNEATMLGGGTITCEVKKAAK